MKKTSRKTNKHKGPKRSPIVDSSIQTPLEKIKALMAEVNAAVPPDADLDALDPGVKQSWMETAPQKRCKGPCQHWKDYNEFARVASMPDGYDTICKECRPIITSKGEVRDADIVQPRGGRPRLGLVQHRVRKLLIAAAMKAGRHQVPYDLQNHVKELEAKLEVGVCELTGQKLNIKESLAANAPALYVVDAEKGMVYANTMIICWAMSCALGSWGPEVLKPIVEAWIKKEKK